MNTPIKHQIVENDGRPLFVLVPYEEYLELIEGEVHEEPTLPLAVSKAANLEGKSLVRAWREYKGLSQGAMAGRMGISRPAYARMEEKNAKLRATTLHRLAAALEVVVEQLREEEDVED